MPPENLDNDAFYFDTRPSQEKYESFNRSLKNMSNLKNLEIGFSNVWTLQNYVTIFGEALSSLAKLKKLHLRFTIYPPRKDLYQELLKYISKLVSLESLTIYTGVESSNLIALKMNNILPNLIQLDIKDEYIFEEQLFDQNNNSLIDMKSVILRKTLSSLNNTIINLKRFDNLEELCFKRKFNDKPSLFYFLGCLGSLSKLIYLELDISLNTNVCGNISDNELTDCLNNCIQRLSHLKTLEFYLDCHGKRCLKIWDFEKNPNLTTLTLKYGDQTDVVDFFSKEHQNLTILNLKLKNITEDIKEKVNSFLKKCGKLDKLTVDIDGFKVENNQILKIIEK